MMNRFKQSFCVAFCFVVAGFGCSSSTSDDEPAAGSGGASGNNLCEGCNESASGGCADCVDGECVGAACQEGAGGNNDMTRDGTGGATPSGTGGTTPVGACGRTVGECSAPQVITTEVDLGATIAGYGNEGDTAPLPLAIAAMPSGGSRIAALGNDGLVHIAELDCEDKIVGNPFSIPAVDLQDIHADSSGGVVLVTRDAENDGTDNCGGGQLCGGESSQCRAMWMVRFNASGQVEWETQVTNLGDNLSGYDNGARFIWWYQHHGRLAFDGENYAAYFGVAITVNNNSCVDIHQGDRMQVVSSSGAPVTDHPDAFQVGCSHAWQSRIVWDPRESRFAMVCTTDNDCRIAQPNPYRTVAQGTCDGTLFGGDLVLSSTPGYWTAWSQGGNIRLEHFTTGASDLTITEAGPSSHPHLVRYGDARMLLSWESGASLTAQIRDAASGETIGAEFSIDVPDHDFQAFKDYPDGSVAYPAAGSSGTTARIARVMPCD